MFATLITKENEKNFLQFIPEETVSLSDVLFGAFDGKSDTACGVVAAEVISPYILSISYIYVDEAYRRKGAGRALIEALIEFSQTSSFSALICEHREDYDANDALISKFLKSCDFDCLDYSRNTTYSISLGSINIKKKKLSGNIVPLKKVSKSSWNKYSKQIKVLEENDDTGFVLELDDMHHYNKELSFLYLDDDENIQGSLLFKTAPNGLFINELQGFGDNTPKIIYSLLQTMDDTAKSLLPSSINIFINATSENILSSIEMITDTHATPVWSNVVDAYFI